MDSQNNTIFHSVDHLAAVAFVGAGAADFLHGQLTVNVQQLPGGQWRRAAYCSRQGRIIACGLLARLPADEDGNAHRFVFIVRADIAEHVVQELSRFILRAKVRAHVLTDDFWAANVATLSTYVPAQQGDIGEENGVAVLNEEGFYRLFFNSGTAAADWHKQIGDIAENNKILWRRNEILRGVPWIGKDTSELLIPQFVNLELLGGVDFDKGCYVGQEVIARLHYRGEVKSRSKIICGNSEVPKSATIVNANGDKVGQLLDSVVHEGRYYALASVKLSAEGQELFVDGVAITLQEPPYSADFKNVE